MNTTDRQAMGEHAKKLREQADGLMRLAPMQALRLQNVAQELELRLRKLAHLEISQVTP